MEKSHKTKSYRGFSPIHSDKEQSISNICGQPHLYAVNALFRCYRYGVAGWAYFAVGGDVGQPVKQRPGFRRSIIGYRGLVLNRAGYANPAGAARLAGLTGLTF